MDKLYIGDIPREFHFAQFNNGYIDLYNTQELSGDNHEYYRIFTNCGGFYYSRGYRNFGYISQQAQNIDVTNDVIYRNDFPNILLMTFIITIFGIFLFNIITSLIRKGGLFGGLL